ncbi:MAG: recombinase RecA [Clostridia bacterium]
MGKEQALSNALRQIEKQFGKGSIMRLGDDSAALDVNVIPTGCLDLDIIVGIGGMPRGRIVEVYGPESSGKTTLALHMLAGAQKIEGTAAFIDAEHALDPKYASNLGVDIENLLVAQPDSGEQALEIAETLVRSNAVDMIIIDSVAALVPRAELEGSMGDSHIGLQARLMSQAMRKLAGIINKSKAVVVFINQIREKVGVMFGNPETTSGGRALKFYSSIRLEIRRVSSIKKGSENFGNRTRIRVVKNKVAPPFKSAEVDIMFGTGISLTGSILDNAVELDLIKKSGSWYSYEDDTIGQGRENAKEFLDENPEVARDLENKIRDHYGLSKLEEVGNDTSE